MHARCTCTFAFAYICIHLHSHLHAGVCKWPWEVPVGQVLVEGDISQTAQVRDEPGSGGVRVGQTRSDLDCRVVATSRRVAPTECDSRLPLFGRGSTCRLRLLDSWPPPGSGVVFDSSRGSTRVSRPVAPTESDSSDKRRTWAVAQLVRLVRLVGRRCHNAETPRTLSDEDVTTRRDSSD
jgi:hypothetical protein